MLGTRRSPFAWSKAIPLVSALVLSAPAALAHVDVSGPATAGKSQVVTFTVGHGCEGADTVRVEIEIPAEVTAVRALPGSFGEAELTKDATGRVTSVAWTKDTARDADDHYYSFPMRIAVPDAPFTTLYFPSTQTCRDAEGDETTIAWAELPGGDPEADPAPGLRILPERHAGWNKYTVDVDITDLSYFADAQIVWQGAAAYSANPTTKALIEGEEGVTTLTSIDAGDEIWVKY